MCMDREQKNFANAFQTFTKLYGEWLIVRGRPDAQSRSGKSRKPERTQGSRDRGNA